MRKSIVYLFGIIGIIIMAMTCIGCSDDSSKLVGKWECIEAIPTNKIMSNIQKLINEVFIGQKIEFFSDGTFAIKEGSGKWSILKDGRIKMETSNKIIILAKLNDDSLQIEWTNESYLYNMHSSLSNNHITCIYKKSISGTEGQTKRRAVAPARGAPEAPK